jgi:23S rRNA (cytosine1962-C5)-methyltransferase
MKYVTKEEMREIDRIAIEKHGIRAVTLMENAGRAVAIEAAKLLRKGRIAVFCGYGNNGGDGFVAARYLIKKGYEVKVFLAGRPRPLSPETNNKLEELMSAGTTLNVISDSSMLAEAFKNIGHVDLVIDAIFGIGLRDALDDLNSELIDKINSISAPIVAIDIPSGLDADTGRPLPKAIRASITVTMGYPKIGFEKPEAKEYVGRLFIADIGLKVKDHPSILLGSGKTKTKEKTISLRSGKMGRLRPGHPWIYKSQIRKFDRSIKLGEMVRVISAEGAFIGCGYFNPASEISIRLLTFKDEVVDAKFLQDRIAASVEKRKTLANLTNAYKAVFSEADGLPGLIVDVYADTVVFQALTLGMDKAKGVIIDGIKQSISPRYIYEKSESPFRKLEGLTDISKWHGDTGNSVVEIFEGKVKFLVDIINGHKTGFYLDQRRSRLALEQFSKDKKVLDIFCYTGGFSASAAFYGASGVRGIDIKDEWLSLAKDNAALNGVSERVQFTCGDAFDLLREIHNSGEKFDVIILDPPSFLKSVRSLKGASKGYKDLNLYAMKILSEGGILATFSCSHNMPNEVFSEILKDAARDAKKKFDIIKRCRQAEDHPIVKEIPETEYLKGYFLKVSSI